MAVTKTNDYNIATNADLGNVLNNVDLNRIGADLTALELDGGTVKVSVGSIIESQGSLYKVDTTAVTPTGTAADGAFLFFDDSVPGFVWSSTEGTYDPARGGIYDVSNRRQCRFLLTSATTYAILEDFGRYNFRRWVFESGSATFTCPYTGYYLITIVGGGGGGGGRGDDVSNNTGGGGGSGGYARKRFFLEKGETIDYAVGVGGTGGSDRTNNATAGTSSTITISAVIEMEGSGGANGIEGPGTFSGAGGDPGLSTIAKMDVAIDGAPGEDGGSGTGLGGRSAMSAAASVTPGRDGSLYGAGGRGAPVGGINDGGDGADGAVIIELVVQ